MYPAEILKKADKRNQIPRISFLIEVKQIFPEKLGQDANELFRFLKKKRIFTRKIIFKMLKCPKSPHKSNIKHL